MRSAFVVLAVASCVAPLIAAAALLGMSARPAAPPEQIHASWLGDAVGIVWARPPGANTAGDGVEWRIDGGAVQRVPASESWRLPKGGVLFSADVPHAGGRFLDYRVGGRYGWSPWHALELRPGDGTWRLAVYGDHGTGRESNNSLSLIPQVVAERPHAVLHAGDLSYADGNSTRWNEWFRLVEPLAASTLYMPVAGNHEHEGAWGGEHPYEEFVHRFRLPGYELHYTFDLGPVRVIALNAEDLCLVPLVLDDRPWKNEPECDGDNLNWALHAWMEDQLVGAADRPWTFVLVHRPPYSSGSHEPGLEVLQKHYALLFERYGVDLVLSGHDHNYQRSFPMRAGVPVSTEHSTYDAPGAPIYLVTGGGGESLYEWECCGDGDADPYPPGWTATRDLAYHFVRIDVREDRLDVRAIGVPNGEVLDQFSLSRPR